MDPLIKKTSLSAITADIFPASRLGHSRSPGARDREGGSWGRSDGEQPRKNNWCPEEDSNLHALRR
jgi:hypothetical protein